jgi:hypothetical protein
MCYEVCYNHPLTRSSSAAIQPVSIQKWYQITGKNYCILWTNYSARKQLVNEIHVGLKIQLNNNKLWVTLAHGTVSGSSGKAKKLPHYTPWRRLGDRRYSSYPFSTLALDKSEWSTPRPGHALSPGKDPRYPLNSRLGGPQSRSGYSGYR